MIFYFKGKKVILLCINMIKDNKISEQLLNDRLTKEKYYFTLMETTF